MTMGSYEPKVGDRIRVVFSTDIACSEAPHFDEEQLGTGQIVRDAPVVGAPSHRFLVVFDRAALCSMSSGLFFDLAARHYRAEELQPLTDWPAGHRQVLS
jgi:hypothetical protein